MKKRTRKDDFPKHQGSQELIERYDINDQAHAKSSMDDFVATTSGFHHADERLQTDTPSHPEPSNQKKEI